MRKLLFFLLTLVAFQISNGATPPTRSLTMASPGNTASIVIVTPANSNNNIKKGAKLTLLQKAKLKLLQYCQSIGFLVDGEMTVKQKRQAKWSLILGLGSLVLLAIPYVGLLSIPAAITGLVLGIKSVEGNTNTNGIIGIIASGLTLLLFLIALAVVATLLASWN